MLDKQRLRTFVLGGAVGALVGILLAPRSGRELRGSLANRAGEARERGRETYFDAQEQMRERLAEVREGSRPAPRGASTSAALRLRRQSPGRRATLPQGRVSDVESEAAERERRREVGGAAQEGGEETRERLGGAGKTASGPER